MLGNHFTNCQQTRLGARSPAHRKNRGQRGESPSGTDALLTWLPGIGQPERGVRRVGGEALGSGLGSQGLWLGGDQGIPGGAAQGPPIVETDVFKAPQLQSPICHRARSQINTRRVAALPFRRSEVPNGCHWAAVKGRGGAASLLKALGENYFLAFPAPGGHPHPWLWDLPPD